MPFGLDVTSTWKHLPIRVSVSLLPCDLLLNVSLILAPVRIRYSHWRRQLWGTGARAPPPPLPTVQFFNTLQSRTNSDIRLGVVAYPVKITLLIPCLSHTESCRRRHWIFASQL